ncbi:unnamed protein product [Dibothriocephalus latus]|uniref:Uncharacterized protein n=1 Tax=Dibothriocephalus latus TaxID=60516 RepID=A0A3P7LW50_DIBLA|nr:unnamed protein product [Dibothriocephalus latus]
MYSGCIGNTVFLVAYCHKQASSRPLRCPLPKPRSPPSQTSLLLYQRIAKGLDIVTPLTDLQPPLVSTLVLYDEALATHFEEMTEVHQAQKRQRMLSYYGEMLAGQRKRQIRRAGQHSSNTQTVDKEGDVPVDEFVMQVAIGTIKLNNWEAQILLSTREAN